MYFEKKFRLKKENKVWQIMVFNRNHFKLIFKNNIKYKPWDFFNENWFLEASNVRIQNNNSFYQVQFDLCLKYDPYLQ